MSLRIAPTSFHRVCAYITQYHRHHKRPRGGKVFLGVYEGADLVGVAVIGRPNARAYDPDRVAEITRTCTAGAAHANSKLYGACRRVAKAMGYKTVITYTEEGESGASLRAAGFVLDAVLEPRENWADASVKLKHLRDPDGRGGVRRYRWKIDFGVESAP